MINLKSWQHHFIAGSFLVFFWFLVVYSLEFEFTLLQLSLIAPISLVTTLFPDIDLRISKVRSAAALASAFVISIVYIYFFPANWYYTPVYFLILYLLIKLIPSKHRGIIHTTKFSLIFSGGILIALNLFIELNFPQNIFWFLIVFSSYNLHLILDRI